MPLSKTKRNNMARELKRGDVIYFLKKCFSTNFKAVVEEGEIIKRDTYPSFNHDGIGLKYLYLVQTKDDGTTLLNNKQIYIKRKMAQNAADRKNKEK